MTLFRRRRNRVRVGIVTTDDLRRGLWRDAESLAWALTRDGAGERRFEVSLFPVAERDSVERDPLAATASRCAGYPYPCASARTRFVDWLDGLHALVSFEYMMPRGFELARDRGIRVCFIPNLDWAVLGAGAEDTNAWTAAVRRSNIQVWARTPAIAGRLRELGIESHEVPWSIPDPVARARPARADDGRVRFLMNAGTGGYQNRRGVDIAIDAFRRAQRRNPALLLTVKTIRPLETYLPAGCLPVGEGVEVKVGFYERLRVGALYRAHDAVLHPSRWEGFGIALLEALHAGAPVLATDGWPMNEVVVDGRSGLLVRAQRTGMFRLAPRWECDVDDLASAMLRFAEQPDLRLRLSCADCDRLEERQRRFVETVRQLLPAAEARA